MRLIKKIKFSRIKEIPQFKKIENSFTKLKEKEVDITLSTIKDISGLNFYFVIEYINIIHNKVNYDKIFPKNKKSGHSDVDYNNLMEEQDKLKKYINNKHLKVPEFFKKIGILNDVIGCFIIATIKKNVKSVKKLDFNKKEQNIIIKLDFNSLPKEFEQICLEFYKAEQSIIEKEYEEFDKFLNLSNEEQDIFIHDILQNIQFPTNISFDPNELEMYNEAKINNFYNKPHSAATIESAAENHINQITDKEFLKGMLNAALLKEDYELCVKIRDRLLIIS